MVASLVRRGAACGRCGGSGAGARDVVAQLLRWMRCRGAGARCGDWAVPGAVVQAVRRVVRRAAGAVAGVAGRGCVMVWWMGGWGTGMRQGDGAAWVRRCDGLAALGGHCRECGVLWVGGEDGVCRLCGVRAAGGAERRLNCEARWPCRAWGCRVGAVPWVWCAVGWR